jgi:sugar (pentulose or hexulose) kinase
VTDYNNALKLGYDPAPAVEGFPDWMLKEPFAAVLPTRVVAPGEPVATLDADVAKKLGLPEAAVVCGASHL